MLSRNLMLSAVLMVSSVNAWMMPIKTMVKNNSSQMINIFCQASGPVVDRYSDEPGWCYDKWPVLNLEPGCEKLIDLWIFREDNSKLKVSVLYADNEEVASGDEVITKYFRSESSLYAGDATFYRMNSSGIKAVHSGNLDCTVIGSGNQYSAQLVIFE